VLLYSFFEVKYVIIFIIIDDATKQMHQVWYDDSLSLKIKTGIAKSAMMRGVGMWTGDFVAYQSDPRSAAEFWAAMQNFFEN
jgi:spore germination protein YaaH